MTVLICGSRNWDDPEAIAAEIDRLPSDTIIVHGGCPTGADAMADALARARGLTVRVFPADWRAHGPNAGPIRNNRMLREGQPDLVLAFARDLDRSTGTRHMVHQARRARVATRVLGLTPPSGSDQPSLFEE